MPNNLNIFKIYNASAGTGKTFNLVKDYLVILLSSKNIHVYKNILAITFTNKAVTEMKGRVVEYLINYSNSIINDSAMIEKIKKETGLKNEEIFFKSSKLLKNLLKNYASFEISTIDKLTQKIIRGFTYELGIDSKYEIEIDQNEILSKAVDNLISKIEIDNIYSKEIFDFSFEKTENDKSWDITKDLQKIAKLLLDENNYSQLELIKDLDTEDFKKCKKTLKTSIKKLKEATIKLANDSLILIKENNLQEESFLRKTLPNHFKKIISRKFDGLYSNRLEENLKNGKLHSSKVSENEIITISKIREELLFHYMSCKQNIYKIKLYNNILSNLSPLSILSLIKKELEEMKNDDNFIMISEFNKIVNDEIKNQPALLIYEKIGVKFNHFFIDEFQDTSKMQWDNLKPLIENSLSSQNSSITIAGDPKQAIYSWRGGDVNEFISLVKNNKSPFFCDKLKVELNKNYRSFKEIVDFNNNIFQHVKEIYNENSQLIDIYNFPIQNNYTDLNGSVNIEFHESNHDLEIKEFYKTKTLEYINNAVKRNYSLKDICVIVRKKKEGIEIGDYLSENNIPIISSEVLNLSASPSVNLIINLIDYSISESNSSKLRLCKSLSKLNLINKQKEDFLIEISRMDFNEIKSQITIKDFSLVLEELRIKSIYEAIEYIIDSFKLAENGNSYIQFLLDFANDYSNKYQTSFIEFLDFYNEKKDKLNIISPKEINAVEIITIHKSKGLEFPIVIYPFANINIHKDLDPKAWINLNDDINLKIKNPLININKDLENIDKKLFDEYRKKLEIDNINLLYVVLTRAKNELYIISEKDIDKNGIEKVNFFSGIFISFLKKIGIWNINKNIYEFGDKINFVNQNDNSKNITQQRFVFNSRNKRNIMINKRNAKAWVENYNDAKEKGNTFHLIMSEIYSPKDINLVLNKFYELGEITIKEKKSLKNTISSTVFHKELEKLFSPELKSYNEREIIRNNGESIIPDRLVFLNDSNVALIDYKTGIKKNSHLSQLNNYERTLSEMGLKTTQKILVYINKKVQVKICK